MFETQHYMDVASDLPKKRGRDDEQDVAPGAFSFCEHRNKRLHSLPVRTSPRVAQQSLPNANIMSLNASPGELRRSHIESFSYLPRESQLQQDLEMDMADGNGVAAAPHPAASHLSSQTDPSARMPTPIQPSFAAQVRGQQHEWAGDGVHSGFPSDDSVPRSMAAEDDWRAVQNNRRLPSPISECDDAMSTSLHPPPPHGMEHPNAMMDVEPRAASQPPETDADSPGPSPERRGHMRSKHTINTWTWQPGMKKSFSVGYRQDCEKCRLKVPGHFNHIVIS